MSELLDNLAKLVSFDTTSHRSNLDAIAFLRERLEAVGAECRLTFDDDSRKANLYAALGPADQPGIMLSGHTDTVPVDPSEWASGPFALTEREGRLYGRGAADMKAFIALCITLAPEFVKRGLTTPLHFSFSYDEEIGCVGVRRLIDDMAGLPVKPRLCIVGEPTGMRVVAGHKGKRSMRCHVRGRECHSALVDGVNAIEAASQVIGRIAAIQKRIRNEGPFNRAYNPPFTTLQTGVISGGRALNIIPRDCDFEWEIRVLPHDDADALMEEVASYARRELEPAMKAVDPGAGFTFEVMNDTLAFDLPDDDPAVKFVTALTGDNATGRVSFGTEAGLFNEAGVPTVVCGPGYITDAHRPDEFIALDQIRQCEAFMARLAERVAGP